MKPTPLAAILLVILAVAATACANTVRGIGKDVKETVKAVDDSVN